ncbi:putative RNA-directed DNA polymerase [Tanacetum coccineum]
MELPTGPNLEPKVFGCTAFVHKDSGKLEPRAIRCMFLGYADFKKGYRCYDPKEKKMYITRDVKFHETVSFFDHDVFPQGEITTNLEGNVIHQNSEFSECLDDTGYEGDGGSGDFETGGASPDQDSTANSYDPEPESSPIPIPTPIPPQGISSNDILSMSPETNNEQVTPRYPVRQNRGVPKRQYQPELTSKSKYPINHYVSTEKLANTQKNMVEELSTVAIPNSVQEALKDPRWRKAIQEEMDALKKNWTWDEVVLPPGKKTVGCRWIFTIKLDSSGKIDRLKARLVAKGYTQKYGIDYRDTFAPVAKINTIRILVSIAANKEWPLRQYDVKNAFLNGNLEEEVYMDPPPGMNFGNKVCKLNKALYGLKQSPRAWFGRFSKFMKGIGYKQSDADHTLFVKNNEGKVTALIVYVDDMVVTGDDEDEMNKLKDVLGAEFELKDLGKLKYFLGIEVARSSRGITMCQRKYTLDLLTETGMLDCKPIDTPIEQNHGLTLLTYKAPTNKERYQKLVGKLIYLSHTRPDIAYAVSVVSRFMHAPNKDHMKAVIRILRYLKSSPGKGLFFAKTGSLEVEGYTDADWAGDKSDGKSTSGYFTFVGGNLVTWRSKKQKVVARSSAESEFRGMVHGVCELLWIKRIMRDLGFEVRESMNLHCDNQAAVKIANNPVLHDRTKHVEVDRHFIRDHLEKKTIKLPHVASKDQLADMLTKAVCTNAFYSSLDKLRMIDIHSSS